MLTVASGLRASAIGAALFGLIGTSVAQELPDYYPEDYSQIVEASRQERPLLIYSNMAPYNWAPVIEGFNKLYPWIQIDTLDLDSDEVFTRYYAESNSGASSAGLMVSATVDGWSIFAEGNNALEYASPEEEKLPEFSMAIDNIYTISTDPMVMVYNKLTVPENQQPKGIADLVRIVEENPGTFQGKLATYDSGRTSFGQAIDLVNLRAKGEDYWTQIEALGPLARTEVSSGPMLAKLASGEYSIAYFVSGVVFFPRLNDPTNAQIYGWSFPEDGTPLFMRQMAIPAKSGSPNAAKLMLDFILSKAGQTAFGIGGLTPYRADVPKEDVAFFTYDSIKQEVGEENILLIDVDEKLMADDAFLQRWRTAYGAR